MTKTFGERQGIRDFQSAYNFTSARLRSKTNLKPRDLTHLGKITLLRLSCRTSTEGNQREKRQTYQIMSKATPRCEARLLV